MPRLHSLAYLTLVPALAWSQAGKDEARFARWEKQIADIEKRLTESPPPKGGIIFAGSSSIRLWDTAKTFPEWKPINCGFGGSEIRDSTHFADRLFVRAEPRAIVLYAGDNDVNAGRTPEQVAADFKAFANTIHAKLPKTNIYFVSIKPSLARLAQFEKQSKANTLVKELCGQDDRLGYIDIVPGMLGEDGKPKPELFVKDGLHLSPAGYEVFTAAVRKAVK